MTHMQWRDTATRAVQLAALSHAEIDAMSDAEIAELMDASAEELASEPAWTWREAAKAATDEFAEHMADDVTHGRAMLLTHTEEIRKSLGGRPRVGGAAGRGPSQQVRVRVTDATRDALEEIARAQGRSLSDVSRDALNEYIATHT